MPTAVGPNTKGEENLVFGYDLGDVSNSYKGEPTENLGDVFPDSSLPSPYIWTYEYSASIVPSPIGNHPYSNQKWVKLVKTSSTNGRVLFIGGTRTSGSIYTVSAYVYIDDSNNTSLAYGSDNSNYSIELSENAYDFNKIGTVQRIHGTWEQQLQSSSVYGLRGGSGNPIGSTIYMTGLQVEEKSKPTQLTAGTRSATQGLLDLTGNSTIDLTNVSFDSNAQKTFDGTDDQFAIDDPGVGTSFSIEIVIKVNDYSNSPIFISPNSVGIDHFFRINSNGTIKAQFVEIADSSADNYTSTTVLNTTDYYHVVISKTPSNGTIYINGVAEDSHTPTLPASAWTGDWRIGARWNSSYWFNGELPLLKVYNRALTASEIKSNYNAVKGRFNI